MITGCDKCMKNYDPVTDDSRCPHSKKQGVQTVEDCDLCGYPKGSDVQHECVFHNIRNLLGWTIGKRIEDITQHDPGEPAKVALMLEGGGVVEFGIRDPGYIHSMEPEP